MLFDAIEARDGRKRGLGHRRRPLGPEHAGLPVHREHEREPARTFPTPPQSGITPATPETYWTGGISAWAVDLAKAGHTVESLPPGGLITFGDGSNPQDLSHYQLFVVVEPQNPFTAGREERDPGLRQRRRRTVHGRRSRDVRSRLRRLGRPARLERSDRRDRGAAAGVFGVWFRVNGTRGSRRRRLVRRRRRRERRDRSGGSDHQRTVRIGCGRPGSLRVDLDGSESGRTTRPRRLTSGGPGKLTEPCA